MKARAAPALLLFAALLHGEEAPNPLVTAVELRTHVQWLASDAWEGRGSGSAGETQATEYIAGVYAKLGLEPAGEEGGWFQPVRMAGGMQVKACSLGLPGDVQPFEPGKEVYPFSLSASATVQGELAFAGYGVSAPDLGYDDYAGLDVRGKVVVVFRHLPRGAGWDGGGVRQRYATFSAKMDEAVKRGALALIVANDPHTFTPPPPAAGEAAEEAGPASGGAGAPGAAGGDAAPPRPRGRRGPAVRSDVVHRGMAGDGEPRIPFVHVTLAASRRLFQAAFGTTPEALDSAIHAGDAPRPASRASATPARLVVEVERVVLEGRNTCALLRAGAPDAVDEIVVVGAHHDHVGTSGVGSLAPPALRNAVHNGADDNASGTSGVLEAAAYLASRRESLRRSILFLTFTGEERGLLGSRHFVEHPTVPLARVVAMLNMDMIGRLEGRRLFIGGVKTSPAFRPLLDRLAAEVGLDATYGDGGMAPSDNTSFYRKQMPVLFFFSGMHRDYHRPSDDADRIDAAGMEKIVTLAARTAEELAKLPERPAFERADGGGAGPPRAVFGIRTEPAEGGVAIATVAPGSAAEKAGLQRGDVLLAVKGTPTPDLAALTDVMGGLQPGETATVLYRRDGEEREVEVTFGSG